MQELNEDEKKRQIREQLFPSKGLIAGSEAVMDNNNRMQ